MENWGNFASAQKVDTQTTERIRALCDIILVYADHLDIEQGKKYIEEHVNENIVFNGDRYGIRLIVQKKTLNYINRAPTESQLFAFKIDNNFYKFRNDFLDYYYWFFKSKNGENAALAHPEEFDCVFDSIQESIELYELYEGFSLKMGDTAAATAKVAVASAENEAQRAAAIAQKAVDTAEKAAKKAAEDVSKQTIQTVNEKIKKAIDTATADAKQNADGVAKDIFQQTIQTVNEEIKKAIDTATADAKQNAEEAAETAKTQILQGEWVEEEIKSKVMTQMNTVTSKLSETSVTILGIFSGIVLTVVAGLFYSSSVLESINATSFCRLLCAAALVGFVCINLIVSMFRFIAKLSGKTRSNKKDLSDNTLSNDGEEGDLSFFSETKIKFVSVVLIIIMIVGFVGQFFEKDADRKDHKPHPDMEFSSTYSDTNSETVSVDLSEEVSNEEQSRVVSTENDSTAP